MSATHDSAAAPGRRTYRVDGPNGPAAELSLDTSLAPQVQAQAAREVAKAAATDLARFFPDEDPDDPEIAEHEKAMNEALDGDA